MFLLRSVSYSYHMKVYDLTVTGSLRLLSVLGFVVCL